MAELISDQEITALESNYQMGQIWTSASDQDQILAVNSAEGIWRSLPWQQVPNMSPFDEPIYLVKLIAILALHARLILEAQGSALIDLPEPVANRLRPYLRKGMAPA